ncbi:MAG: T9SS type A sorting domain-containing protein [Ignavibacteriae bacterium]|nr:T9SS type A sorting domain-containing protein [Ignavibacteriota bacterium]
MKDPIIISLGFCLLLCISNIASSQTEIWRVSGFYKHIYEDANRNTYIAQDYESPNIKKVDPTGTILWTAHVDYQYFGANFVGSGIYISPYIGGSGNAIYFYDTSGALVWTYELPPSTLPVGYAQTDQGGDLIYVYNSIPTPFSFDMLSSKLLKINKDGNKVFEVVMPKLNQEGLYQHRFMGPFVSATGNIWLVREAQIRILRSRGFAQSEKVILYTDAFLFDGQTGDLLMVKNIFSGLIGSFQEDGRGNIKEYGVEIPVLGKLSIDENDLIAYGRFAFYKGQCRANGKCKYVNRSEWRMVRIDQQGKSNFFRYRGKGEIRYVDDAVSSRGDDGLNDLNNVEVGNNSIYFLHGLITIGKSVNDIGNFHIDEVIMRFNSNAKTIGWKIVIPYGPGNIFFYKPAQKIFHVIKDNLTFDVYDAAGGLSSIPLSFSESVSPASSNASYGYFYGHSNKDNQLYLVKYYIGDVLLNQTYNLHVNLIAEEIAHSFALSQNYPNPFNPTTTIEFELAQDALVTVKVYNTLGQEVTTLAEREEFGEGVNELEFDGSNLPSGVYYYRIVAENLEGESVHYSSVKKMLLLK